MGVIVKTPETKESRLGKKGGETALCASCGLQRGDPWGSGGRRAPPRRSVNLTCAKLACSDGTCALSQRLPVNSLLKFRLSLTTEEPNSKTRWFATEHRNKRRNVTTEYDLWSPVSTIGLPNLNIYKPAMLPLDVLGTKSIYTRKKTSVFFFKNVVI